MMEYKGVIVDINKYIDEGVCIKQKVRKSEQYKYANYSGDNGTYVIGGIYMGPCLVVTIKVNGVGLKEIDVYEDIKRLSGKTRVSSQLLEKLKKHEGEEIVLHSGNGIDFEFDKELLLR